MEAAQSPESTTLLFSDNVLLGAVDDLSIGPALIRIQGGIIHGVDRVSREQVAKSWPTQHVRDLGQLLVTPAFVNAHTHLAMNAFRGLAESRHLAQNVVTDLFFKLEAGLSAGDIRAFTRLGAYESLCSGVAEVWDHYYSGLAVADGLRDAGLSGVVAPTLQDLAGPGRNAWEEQLQATVDIDESSFYRAGGIFAALGPHATDTVSSALWRHAVDMANVRELPVHAHVAQSLDEYRTLLEREGCSPLEWLYRSGLLDVKSAVLAHCLFCSRADLKRLDHARHALVVCPHSQAKFGFMAPVASWQELGLNWAVGTDCAVTNDGMNPQQELRLLSDSALAALSESAAHRRFFEQGGLHSAEDLDECRRGVGGGPLTEPTILLKHLWAAASGLHPRRRVGEIADGAKAHLAFWDPRHPSLWPARDLLRSLCYCDITQALCGLMVSGNFVGKIGDFRADMLDSDEYSSALREADQRLESLLGRLK